jgi:hypothetical protein
MATENTTLVAPEEPAAKTRPKGSKALFNLCLDAALLLAALFLVWVSALMQVVFPAPTAAVGWTLWGLTFDQWRDAQFISLCVCGLLALEHIVLHWNWVCGIIATKVLRLKKRPAEGIQAVYGVGFFITILSLMLGGIVAALFTVRPPSP